MSWAVRAWRSGNGQHGVTIGTVTPVGWDNHVAEITLTDAEIDEFLAEFLAARTRANGLPERFEEPLPDAYERWPHD